MDTTATSRYGPHDDGTAPRLQPGLDRRVPELVPITPAAMDQRRAINTRAAAEPAEVSRRRVAAYYGRGGAR